MAITLPDATRRDLVVGIQAWFRDERDEEIGELQAGFLLDFVLEHVGPSVYNKALRDAQARLRVLVDELDVTLQEPEATGRRAVERASGARGHRKEPSQAPLDLGRPAVTERSTGGDRPVTGRVACYRTSRKAPDGRQNVRRERTRAYARGDARHEGAHAQRHRGERGEHAGWVSAAR